jgi:hypothetical protein
MIKEYTSKELDNYLEKNASKKGLSYNLQDGHGIHLPTKKVIWIIRGKYYIAKLHENIIWEHNTFTLEQVLKEECKFYYL